MITQKNALAHAYSMYTVRRKCNKQVQQRQNSLQRHQFAVALQYFCNGLSTFLLNGIILEAD